MMELFTGRGEKIEKVDLPHDAMSVRKGIRIRKMPIRQDSIPAENIHI